MTTTEPLLCGCTDRPHEGLGMCSLHYHRERNRAVRAGEWSPEEMIEVTVVQQHIAELRRHGASVRGIGKATGLSHRHLQHILDGSYSTVRRTTARKLLRLRAEDVESGKSVPALGATRRLQALAALGYEQEDISGRIRSSRSRISAITTGARTMITRDLDQRIRALYGELEMTPGPSDFARRGAKRKGYAVPLLWNEGEMDDPAAKPSKYSWDRYQGGHRVVR